MCELKSVLGKGNGPDAGEIKKIRQPGTVVRADEDQEVPRTDCRGATGADRCADRGLRPYLAHADRSRSEASRTPFVRCRADALGRVRSPGGCARSGWSGRMGCRASTGSSWSWPKARRLSATRSRAALPGGTRRSGVNGSSRSMTGYLRLSSITWKQQSHPAMMVSRRSHRVRWVQGAGGRPRRASGW